MKKGFLTTEFWLTVALALPVVVTQFQEILTQGHAAYTKGDILGVAAVVFYGAYRLVLKLQSMRTSAPAVPVTGQLG